MTKKILKTTKKKKVYNSCFNPQLLERINKKILKELSSSDFKIPKINKKNSLSEFNKLDIKTIVSQISRKPLKKGGAFYGEGEDIEPSNNLMENDDFMFNDDEDNISNMLTSQSDLKEGVSVEELEELSEQNQFLFQSSALDKRGKLTKAVESIISSKFPFYIRIMTVLIKVFVCIMFSTLTLRQLGREYATKYIIGLLIRYPDVCAVLTGNFLSSLGSLGKQLQSFPLIENIIKFINSLTGGSLSIANLYLGKIINFFEKNIKKITSYSTFFDFVYKILKSYSMSDLSNPESIKKILTEPKVIMRLKGAFMTIIIKILCPENTSGNIREQTCQIVNYIIRVPCFLLSISTIAQDFIISVAPLYTYYILGSSTMASNLCTSVCASLYNSGDAIISPRDDCLSANQQRLKDDMKIAYSTDSSAQQMRVSKFGNTYDQGELKNSKIMIDRLVDNESMQKFNLYITKPVSKVITSGVNNSIQSAVGSFLSVPKTVYWVANKGSWLVDKALEKTGIREMPMKEVVTKDKDGNLVRRVLDNQYQLKSKDELKEGDKIMRVTTLDKGLETLKRKTLGVEGLDLSGKIKSIPENINRNLRSHHRNVLDNLYKSDENLKDYDYFEKERKEKSGLITMDEIKEKEKGVVERLINKSSTDSMNTQRWRDLVNEKGLYGARKYIWDSKENPETMSLTQNDKTVDKIEQSIKNEHDKIAQIQAKIKQLDHLKKESIVQENKDHISSLYKEENKMNSFVDDFVSKNKEDPDNKLTDWQLKQIGMRKYKNASGNYFQKLNNDSEAYKYVNNNKFNFGNRLKNLITSPSDKSLDQQFRDKQLENERFIQRMNQKKEELIQNLPELDGTAKPTIDYSGIFNSKERESEFPLNEIQRLNLGYSDDLDNSNQLSNMEDQDEDQYLEKVSEEEPYDYLTDDREQHESESEESNKLEEEIYFKGGKKRKKKDSKKIIDIKSCKTQIVKPNKKRLTKKKNNQTKKKRA